MARKNEFYRETGGVGDASQYSIPVHKGKSVKPFEVPTADVKKLNEKEYRLTKGPALRMREKDFRRFYNSSVESYLAGIAGNGSKENAESLNKAFLGFAKDNDLDPRDVCILAENVKVGSWGLPGRSIKSKLEEKFDLNTLFSEEVGKGIYLGPKGVKEPKK